MIDLVCFGTDDIMKGVGGLAAFHVDCSGDGIGRVVKGRAGGGLEDTEELLVVGVALPPPLAISTALLGGGSACLPT